MADVRGKYTAPAPASRRRGFVPILLGAALSLVIDVAAAEIASDNELYAAYCVGVVQDAQKHWRKELLETEDENHYKQILQETLKDLDQRLSRFQTYLTARGFRTGVRGQEATTGFLLAVKRGQSDAQQCSQYNDKNCNPRCTAA